MLEWGLLAITVICFIFVMKKGYEFLAKHAQHIPRRQVSIKTN